MRTLSRLLVGLGSLLILAAALSGLAGVNALLERMRFGPGPLFADVELFGVIAVALGALGAGAVYLGIQLARRTPKS